MLLFWNTFHDFFSSFIKFFFVNYKRTSREVCNEYSGLTIINPWPLLPQLAPPLLPSQGYLRQFLISYHQKDFLVLLAGSSHLQDYFHLLDKGLLGLQELLVLDERERNVASDLTLWASSPWEQMKPSSSYQSLSTYMSSSINSSSVQEPTVSEISESGKC